jgi:glutamate/tyrosine decarboxylase-like PLP-dependent enzyme
MWVPESSRRARALPAYAAIRSLGREGIADLVERNCALARRFAVALRDHVEVLNDVVLNQVLIAVDDDVIARVQQSGEAWMGGTTWHGRRAMRISVSNWRTTESDVDRAVAAILSSL